MKDHSPALFCLFLCATGCGNDMPDAPPQPDSLAPPPAGQGFQYAMTSTINAGQEIERCRFFTAPPGGFYVNHDEVRYTPGSHHVLMYLTPYTSIPTQDRNGQTHDTSAVFDCASGASADWQVTGILSGAQSFAASSMVSLPPNVGIKVPEGSVLLMNTHYLNATQSALDATALINVYTIPPEQVQTEGGVMFFYNPFIRVPGMSKASTRMRCPVPSDVTVTTMQSHMHARGVGYLANLLDGSGAVLEQLYQNTEWQNVPVTMWNPGQVLHAGTAIDYRCDYLNTETRTVLQGFSTKDEMCVLVGSYYPKTKGFDNCENPTWVGTGTTAGADTLSCLQMAAGASDAMYGCIVSSCPGIAAELTAALMCQFSQGNGTCQSACASGQSMCQSCIVKACQSQLAAFGAATCG